MLLDHVDGGGWCLWDDCIIALGAFLLKERMKGNSSQRRLLLPPSSASMSNYPYGVLLLRPREEFE